MSEMVELSLTFEEAKILSLACLKAAQKPGEVNLSDPMRDAAIVEGRDDLESAKRKLVQAVLGIKFEAAHETT